MKICLVGLEIFAWGKYGGYGRATRILGRELVRKGVTVYAVVPRRRDQKPVEELDGVTVLSFPVTQPGAARVLLQRCNADLYHSQQPSFSTYLAMRAMPDRKHLITFRDPKSLGDWIVELAHPSRSIWRTLLWWSYESLGARAAIARADGLFACSPDVASRASRVYRLGSAPSVLPTPIEIPARPPRKSPGPTVCFLSRWDRRKRPELFFELAAQRPDVHFIALGAGQRERYENHLRKQYGSLPNLEMTGFLDPFTTNSLAEVLEQSWIVVNTSVREGLPSSFLEALAHRCALLSSVNPDGLAERFGVQALGDRFADALDLLLEGAAWRARGEAGYRFVREHYDLEKAIDRHLDLYAKTLSGNSTRLACAS